MKPAQQMLHASIPALFFLLGTFTVTRGGRKGALGATSQKMQFYGGKLSILIHLVEESLEG
jgi:hypothetical protein